MSDLDAEARRGYCVHGRGPADRRSCCSPPVRSIWARPRRCARALPDRQIRMIGAWCFLDHYGPEDVSDSPGMQVWAHPHTGLQTVSWLLDGEIEHRDSLGSRAMVRPGELQHHDCRSRHRALARSRSRTSRRCCTACSCGSRCRTQCAAREPAFGSYRELPDLIRPGVRGQGADRRAGRDQVARALLHPTGRRGAEP